MQANEVKSFLEGKLPGTKVEVEGEGKVCHEGTKSCFTKTIVSAEPQPASALPEAAL